MVSSSKNEKVQNFLNDLQAVDEKMFDLIAEMRSIIFKAYPQVQEKMMYGGIIFSLDDEMFGGLFAYKNHVSLEFSNGYLMEDAHKYLEGKGKFRRHLKIVEKDDINRKEVEGFVKQVV